LGRAASIRVHRIAIKESNVERFLGIDPAGAGEETTATESYVNEATAMIPMHAGLYPACTVDDEIRLKEKLNVLRDETSHEEVSAQEHRNWKKIARSLSIKRYRSRSCWNTSGGKDTTSLSSVNLYFSS
jgi:hypothetical protein